MNFKLNLNWISSSFIAPLAFLLRFCFLLIILFSFVSLFLHPQSTYLPRVPQCLSPRPNWDLPPPRKRVCPSPGTKGGGVAHSPAVRGWEGPNSDNWRKSLALLLLCAFNLSLRILLLFWLRPCAS
jgi:hypothetical protein